MLDLPDLPDFAEALELYAVAIGSGAEDRDLPERWLVSIACR